MRHSGKTFTICTLSSLKKNSRKTVQFPRKRYDVYLSLVFPPSFELGHHLMRPQREIDFSPTPFGQYFNIFCRFLFVRFIFRWPHFTGLLLISSSDDCIIMFCVFFFVFFSVKYFLIFKSIFFFFLYFHFCLFQQIKRFVCTLFIYLFILFFIYAQIAIELVYSQ